MKLTSRLYRSALSTLALAGFLTISSQAQALTLKIATSSPDGSSWMVSMRKAAKDIEAQTDGRVKMKFYPGGVMGTDKAVLKKMRIGQLHGTAISTGNLSAFTPDIQVYNQPFLFESFEEVDQIRTKYDPLLVKALRNNGIVSFGFAEGGFAYVMSNKDPITTVESLRQRKVWIPSGDPASTQALEAYGVAPIPLPISDVLASLQTGLIDTVASSPIGTIALQWHTQVKNMTQLPVMYFAATLAISNKAFKRIKADDQKIVTQTLTETFKQIDQQNRADNISATEALGELGIEIIEPSAEDLKEWHRIAKTARANFITGAKINPATAKDIDTMLKTLRSAP